jgi:hypothetical protein
MDQSPLLAAGALASLVLEGIKWLIRLAGKQPEFNFPVKFYLFMIPVLSFATIPLLAWLGIAGYAMPVDWLGWAKEGIVVILAALITNFVATNPLQAYAKARNAQIQAAKVQPPVE